MPHPLFPLGAGIPAAPPPAPPTPPFWTALGPDALGWQAVTAGQMPRFEHIFPQEPGADQQWRRDTDSPFGTP